LFVASVSVTISLVVVADGFYGSSWVCVLVSFLFYFLSPVMFMCLYCLCFFLSCIVCCVPVLTEIGCSIWFHKPVWSGWFYFNPWGFFSNVIGSLIWVCLRLFDCVVVPALFVSLLFQICWVLQLSGASGLPPIRLYLWLCSLSCSKELLCLLLVQGVVGTWFWFRVGSRSIRYALNPCWFMLMLSLFIFFCNLVSCPYAGSLGCACVECYFS
jgi:hypothetical protein